MGGVILDEADKSDVEGEARAIQEFNNDHATDANLKRPFEEIAETIEKSVYLKLIEPGSSEIVGVAAAFPLNEDDRVFEFGGTAIASSFQGHSLQRVLSYGRIAALIALEGAESIGNEPISMWSVIKTQGASSYNIKKSGFIEKEDPDPILLEPCKRCPEQSSLPADKKCCAYFYKLPYTEYRSRIAKILDILDGDNCFQQKGMSVSVKAPHIVEDPYRAALRNFADST